MPLSKIQTEILTALASHRDPESYVGGSTPLNQAAPRFSKDIDVFHDREERVKDSALKDAAALESAGFSVKWVRQLSSIYTASVTRNGEKTRIEWVADSANCATSLIS